MAKDCTCVGFCRGKAGLAPGWECVLDRQLKAWGPAFDGDAPITEEYLLSLGFVGGNEYPSKNGFTFLELENGEATVTVSQPVDGSEEWCVGGERVPHATMPENRGELRSLLNKIGFGKKAQVETSGR